VDSCALFVAGVCEDGAGACDCCGVLEGCAGAVVTIEGHSTESTVRTKQRTVPNKEGLSAYVDREFIIVRIEAASKGNRI
jgi:hypothetical protein